MPRRLIGVLSVCLLAACNGITYPTSPTINPPTSGPTATNILLSATPATLPSSGGSAEIMVNVITRNAAGVESGMPGQLVRLSSTEGTLDSAAITTNEAGQGTVRWTTSKTGTVIARTGAVDGNVTVTVEQPQLPPSVPPPPAPVPPPLPPLPTPPSPPLPTEMPVTLAVSPETVVIGNPVTLTATATPPTGTGSIRGYEWTFGDGTPMLTTGSASTTHSYTAAGTFTPSVTARTTTWATGTASASVTVNPVPPPPPPTFTVSLAATPTTVVAGGTVAFTATTSGLQTGETIDSYQWDFDGNGSFEVTSGPGANTQSHLYPAQGVFTAKVRVITSLDRTADGTRRVTITN